MLAAVTAAERRDVSEVTVIQHSLGHSDGVSLEILLREMVIPEQP